MSPSSRQQRAAARIRRIACLDAGGPQFAPLLLRELADVLGFDSSGYFYMGEKDLPDFYSDAPEVQAMVPLYLDERMQAAERAVARPFALAARQDFGPQMYEQLITVTNAQFRNSDYYNVLLRPAGIEDCVSLIPRMAGHTPAGALKFYRRGDRARFRREDVAMLAHLEPFLARLLQPRTSVPGDGEVRQGRALLVTTPDGRVLWQSSGADDLMAKAFGPHWYRRGSLPTRCSQVLDRLRQVHRGVADVHLPETRWRDARGMFTLRGSTLDSPDGDSSTVALEIEHSAPRRLTLIERLNALALPDRQFEIAYWLAQDLVEPQIAARLGLSIHTLVYHRRRLYERLAVHSRKELMVLLGQG